MKRARWVKWYHGRMHGAFSNGICLISACVSVCVCLWLCVCVCVCVCAAQKTPEMSHVWPLSFPLPEEEYHMPAGIHMCGWCVFEHKHSSHVILDAKGQRLYCSIMFPGWWWKDGDDQVASSTINKPQCYFRQVGQIYFTTILLFIAKLK